jgi:hypothetical protein
VEQTSLLRVKSQSPYVALVRAMTVEQQRLLDSLSIEQIRDYLDKRRSKEYVPECPYAKYAGEEPCDYHTMSGCTFYQQGTSK